MRCCVRAPQFFTFSGTTTSFVVCPRVFTACSPTPLRRQRAGPRADALAPPNNNKADVATVELFQDTAAMQVLIHSLRHSPAAVVTVEAFEQAALAAGIDDIPRALQALDAAGVVVDLHDCVHVKPGRLVRHVGHVVARPWDPAAVRRVALQTALNDKAPLDERVRAAAERAAHERKRVWCGALAFAGAQLAVISRLTYFDLDWDIMEPVSYFLGTGTALLFYGFLLLFRREHTYEAFDEVYLSGRVQRLLRRDGFDFERYAALGRLVAEERAAVASIERWYDSEGDS